MIPIPGFESVQFNWVTIKGQGFTLHGFLLYSVSDHYFPEYMDNEGLLDLEQWTGKDLGVFIVQSPSQKWIEYARSTPNHTWWKLFGTQVEFLEEHQDAAILQTNEGLKTLREVFAPSNQFLHAREISKILDWFGFKRTEHPCMVLFKDLRDLKVWYVDWRDALNNPKQMLRISLQQWFESADFEMIMRKARNA